MNETNQQPADGKPEMTPAQIAAAQKAGRLIYRPIPYQVGEETRIKTSDHATYRLDGTTLRRVTPKVKTKKKDRIRARKLAASSVGREIRPHRSGGGEVLNLQGEKP